MQGSGYIIDFEVLSFFVLLFISLYMRIKYSMTTEQNREFLRVVISIGIANLFDVLGALSVKYSWGVFANHFFNFFYFFSAAMVSYIFLMYVFSFYYKDDRAEKLRKKGFNQIIFLSFAGLLVVNLFTGILFYFDAEGAYTHGPLYLLTLIIPAFFFLQAAVFILMHRKFYSRAELILLLFFTLFVSAWPAVQALFFPYYLTNFFIGTLMVFLILITIETPDEQELFVTIERLDRIKSELEEKVAEENRILEERENKLSNLTMQMMSALTKAVDAKDRYTSGHSSRVAYYSRLLSKQLGMSKEEQDDIYKMGLLHDVGKIGVPRKIINKPGRLTDEEFDIMRSHPVKGYEILSRITAMPGISKGARWHHERPDGKGYPDHLKAEDIPFEAKIIAVADSYDAMTSFRSYRDVMPQEAVREQIVKGRGTQFDEKVADAMLVLIDEDRDYLMREPERTGGKASA